MSGLEVGALVAAFIGAGAGSISAYKDLKKNRVQAEITTWDDGITRVKQERIALAQGDSRASVLANGDLVAESRSGGSAMSIYTLTDEKLWTNKKVDEKKKRKQQKLVKRG